MIDMKEWFDHMQVAEPRYIGDGVYVGFDPFGQCIMATQRPECVHWIAVDQEIVTQVLAFIQQPPKAK